MNFQPSGKNKALSKKLKSSQNPQLNNFLSKQKEPTLEISQDRLFSYHSQANKKKNLDKLQKILDLLDSDFQSS